MRSGENGHDRLSKDKLVRCDEMSKKIDWFTSCGRTWLSVNGYVIAVEGDQCRDSELQKQFNSEFWTDNMIKFVSKTPLKNSECI